MRTDEHNNPTAFTTDIAKQGGLVLGTDYAQGAPFQDGAVTRYTAKLLGDPIALTIQVINRIGFYTSHGSPRWSYRDGTIGIPKALWDALTHQQMVLVIGVLYAHEGGTAMRGLFV
jgi:hypothetical protein